MHKALKWAAIIYLLFLILFASLLLIPPLFGWHIHSATGDSMYPTLKNGSLVVSVPVEPADIELGDIIVFKNSSGETVIPRVVDIFILEDENYHFNTRGDAEEKTDSSINENDIIGRQHIHIPILGRLVQFIRMPVGLVLTTIITAVWVYTLFKERKAAGLE